MKKILDWKHYTDTAVQAVAEGIVLLENHNQALPLNPNKEIAIFGRIQLHYYKSGTGSGGMVNVSHVVSIPEGLEQAGIKINQKLFHLYQEWDEQHPYDLGGGWSGEPWSQKEMPLEDSLVKEISESCETAVIIIGRTAGEEQDNKLEKGSYLLTDEEETMLALTRKYFKKIIILLNTGNLIDMHFVDIYKPDAVLYVWHGGMTGGTGTAKVLTGEISPSGKLPDTIAYEISDYPSDKNFGNQEKDIYQEDIYVGYRYFETFETAKKKVRYPFGYGLSYTSFAIQSGDWVIDESDNQIYIHIKITNTGNFAGKEVVQIYCKAPEGKLDKPARVLTAYQKTKLLNPGESETLTLPLIPPVSYDDQQATAYPYCNVLEAGIYEFYIGSDVRSAKAEAFIQIPETVPSPQKQQALAPVEKFARMTNQPDIYKDTPLLNHDEKTRILENLPEEFPHTEKKSVLADVLHEKITMQEFIAQFSDAELCQIVRGEGMGSPRVTPGTASAFGGVSDALESYGIPAGCCSDGPSGMRLDCGTKAFSLPIGTMLAATFNRDLITELFTDVGLEMSANHVDCLLGPGMNIHRHPLNGRNFEYFSEDPFLTGTIASAELAGLHQSGVTGTLKHFCGNNQETNRHFLNSVVSERALREIYLRSFEIAVKEGHAKSIMTTYGAINGIWTACNYDLCTEILRKEWGFTGFVMTDWWANLNQDRQAPDKKLFSAMVRAQNDVYMVCADCVTHEDNLLESLADGSLTRAELQRNASNICNFLLHTNAMKRLLGEEDEIAIINRPEEEISSSAPVAFYDADENFTLNLNHISAQKQTDYSFALNLKVPGWYEVTLTASSTEGELAQMAVTLFSMGTASGTFIWNGTDGKPVSFTKKIPLFSKYTAIRLHFAQNGLNMHSIQFRLISDQIDTADLAGE
ncbi:MAG: glycoside hydrolase family 3 protein [Oscillospiraceae bacterium]|nr:glycoside hydrolase family 3 protein [Oscillospiraceae bacterium]